MPMEPVDYSGDGHVPAQESGYHTDALGNKKWGRDGKSVNEMCWDLLDECIDQIHKLPKGADRTSEQEDDFRDLRGYAQGVADCLAFWAPPLYQTRELVLREAQSRWKMRMGQLDFRPTPGYNAGWKPEPGEKFSGPKPVNTALDRHNKQAAKKAAKKTATKKAIPADAVAGVKLALESGWEVSQIAKLYKVSEEQVEELRN